MIPQIPTRTPVAAGPAAVGEADGHLVRTEFRAEVLVFDAEDPVFGGGACRVTGCERAARGHGCARATISAGSTRAVRTWTGSSPAPIPVAARRARTRSARSSGAATGCARRDVMLHAQRWDRAGRPDRTVWLTDPLAVKQPPRRTRSARSDTAICGRHAASAFCHSHHATWKATDVPRWTGSPTPSRSSLSRPTRSICLEGLSSQLKLEVAYALQCRRDDRGSRCPPAVVMQVVRIPA